jgi:hypothetical protein
MFSAILRNMRPRRPKGRSSMRRTETTAFETDCGRWPVRAEASIQFCRTLGVHLNN